jgi:serine/threonine-protein kinase HipA
MSVNRCLFCYQPLEDPRTDFHPACSRKFFGSPDPPLLDFTEEALPELGYEVIKSQTAVTGVQPKLSLDVQKMKATPGPDRFTIVGLWGGYILKPPGPHYEELPELEDLTMHMAGLAGINTVPHSLIRMKSGALAYITKRVDRVGKNKIHMEDMCQLTDRLTEHKYKGSYEQIGKAIVNHSENPYLDLIIFFEQLVFSFLTGNADMHLKNFSLINLSKGGYTLCPAYDMVPSALIVEGDREELALNLNGKKRKLNMEDFTTAMKRFEVENKSIENIFTKFLKSYPVWREFIDTSFLSAKMKEAYIELITNKFLQIGYDVR